MKDPLASVSVLRTRTGRSRLCVLPNIAAFEVCHRISCVQMIVSELGSRGSVTGWTLPPCNAGQP